MYTRACGFVHIREYMCVHANMRDKVFLCFKRVVFSLRLKWAYLRVCWWCQCGECVGGVNVVSVLVVSTW